MMTVSKCLSIARLLFRSSVINVGARRHAWHRAKCPICGRDEWVFLCTAGLQSVLVRVRGGRGAGGHPELGEDVAHVASHGLLADEELGRDGAVRLAGGNEAYDLRSEERRVGEEGRSR